MNHIKLNLSTKNIIGTISKGDNGWELTIKGVQNEGNLSEIVLRAISDKATAFELAQRFANVLKK